MCGGGGGSGERESKRDGEKKETREEGLLSSFPIFFHFFSLYNSRLMINNSSAPASKQGRIVSRKPSTMRMCPNVAGHDYIENPPKNFFLPPPFLLIDCNLAPRPYCLSHNSRSTATWNYYEESKTFKNLLLPSLILEKTCLVQSTHAHSFQLLFAIAYCCKRKGEISLPPPPVRIQWRVSGSLWRKEREGKMGKVPAKASLPVSSFCSSSLYLRHRSRDLQTGLGRKKL